MDGFSNANPPTATAHQEVLQQSDRGFFAADARIGIDSEEDEDYGLDVLSVNETNKIDHDGKQGRERQ